MTAFDDMIAAGMGDAEYVFGTTSWTMDGRAYTGVLNEFEGEQETELDGVLGNYNATLICQRGQFRLLAKPLQRTLNGKQIIIESMTYKVARVAVDSAGVTLGLRIAR